MRMPAPSAVRGLDDVKPALYFLANDLPTALFPLCIMLSEFSEILPELGYVRPIYLAVQVFNCQGHEVDTRPSRYTFEHGFIMISEPLFAADRAGPLTASDLDPEHVPAMGTVESYEAVLIVHRKSPAYKGTDKDISTAPFADPRKLSGL